MKFLYRCRILCKPNCFTLICESQYGRHTINFRGSEVGFKSFLRKIRAKDSISNPASKRKLTYQQIIDLVKLGKNSYIYVWNYHLPKTMIVKESIDLNKNYLYEDIEVENYINLKYLKESFQSEIGQAMIVSEYLWDLLPDNLIIEEVFLPIKESIFRKFSDSYGMNMYMGYEHKILDEDFNAIFSIFFMGNMNMFVAFLVDAKDLNEYLPFAYYDIESKKLDFIDKNETLRFIDKRI